MTAAWVDTPEHSVACGSSVILLNPSAFKMRLDKAGYLAGAFPGGITTVDGVPTPATVRVLYRAEPGQPGDGALVAEVQSAPDGSWRVDGLDPALKFDVVGRKAWFNDVIMSNVSPKVD